MSICPHCGGHTPTPRHSEKLRSLFAARVGLPAKVNRRSTDAAHNEMATDVVAAAIDGDARAIRTVVRHAEDFIDPSRACPEPRRAVEMPECGPSAQNIVDCLRAIYDITGEDADRFDADWDGGVK